MARPKYHQTSESRQPFFNSLLVIGMLNAKLLFDNKFNQCRLKVESLQLRQADPIRCSQSRSCCQKRDLSKPGTYPHLNTLRDSDHIRQDIRPPPNETELIIIGVSAKHSSRQ